jgi:Sigma-70 region 2
MALTPVQQTKADVHTDEELVARARARDEAAVRAITTRYNRRLFRVARSILRDDAEAEDVVQETYVRAFTGLDMFRGERGVPRPEGAGRVAGTPNKMTALAKEMIEEAAQRIGGIERLTKWILKQPAKERIFWSQMYTKLLPLQVRGPAQDGSLVMDMKITMEELRRRLEERGLPLSVFGTDVPALDELEAEKVNGDRS